MKRVLASYIKKSDDQDPIVGLSSMFNGLETQVLSCTPWIKFPYKPAVSFTIAHNEDYVFLKYFVVEKAIRAVNTQVNSAVWEDSCVEFFIHFNDGKGYYNFEFNCIGTQLVGFGKSLSDRELLPAAVVGNIKSESFVSTVKIKGSIYWELSVAIPLSTFVHHHLVSLVGRQGRANFYKCGDKLPEPHFVAWCAIESEEPNFHLPDFFGEIYFQ